VCIHQQGNTLCASELQGEANSPGINAIGNHFVEAENSASLEHPAQNRLLAH
jgi:hypothetical protein